MTRPRDCVVPLAIINYCWTTHACVAGHVDPQPTQQRQHYFRYNVTDSLQSFKDFLYLSQATQVAWNPPPGGRVGVVVGGGD